MLQYVKDIKDFNDKPFSYTLEVIFHFCQSNKNFLIQLRDNNLLYLLLTKWNKFIPITHEQIAKNIVISEQRQYNLLTEYILAFNIGAIWNVIVKWLENDMKDPAENIKATITNYLLLINEINLRSI